MPSPPSDRRMRQGLSSPAVEAFWEESRSDLRARALRLITFDELMIQLWVRAFIAGITHLIDWAYWEIDGKTMPWNRKPAGVPVTPAMEGGTR